VQAAWAQVAWVQVALALDAQEQDEQVQAVHRLTPGYCYIRCSSQFTFIFHLSSRPARASNKRLPLSP